VRANVVESVNDFVALFAGRANDRPAQQRRGDCQFDFAPRAQRPR
jgi:hypothetical protein